MRPYTALASAFGRDKQARDIADGMNLAWCKRTVQMVLAAMGAHHFAYRGREGAIMNGPVTQPSRRRVPAFRLSPIFSSAGGKRAFMGGPAPYVA